MIGTCQLQGFRNPAEFTVVLTGAITEDALLPLVCRYLASIPAQEQPQPLQPRDITPLPFSFPQRPHEANVKCLSCPACLPSPAHDL